MSTEPKYIILLGPPGSGKGTQAAQLKEKLNLPHISSGDLFRHNLNNETELGLKAKSYMDRGELVPDAITIAMVMERLQQPDCQEGALLDGFPRTITQAQALDKELAEQGHEISLAPLIDVPDAVVIERISGRLICRKCQATFHKLFNPFESCPYDQCEGEHLYQRDDDKPEAVRKRLLVYKEQTQPLIDYYHTQEKLVKIKGDQPIDQVQADLAATIRKRTD